MLQDSIKLTLIWQDLCVARGGRHLLSNFSGQVVSGQILLVQGDNGVGKTSFLRVLSGLLLPAKGQISCHIHDQTHQDYCIDLGTLEYGLHIGYLSHKNGLKRGLTVAEDLTFWGNLSQPKTDYKLSLADVINRLHLGELLDRPCHLLSSGQSRRVAFARMLLTDRLVWILDEPLVGLDQQARHDIITAITDHQARGGSVIIANHDPLALSKTEYLDLSVYRSHNSSKIQIEEEWLSL